jgi:N-acetylmuramoyl-L-alanine amidase
MKLVLLLFFLCHSSFSFTVLVDPGHGGHDDGAKAKQYKNKKWKMIKEKDIALSLSKKIHYYLKKNNINVYLTRSIDRAVSLEERAELADKIKADLFISVHINSSEGSSPRGVETYYLDNHKDDVVKKIESIENKDLKGVELVINDILTDLVIERTTKKSKLLASSIHGEILGRMGKRYKLKDRGIRPGLFYVLALTKRPGILLEVGFLSNPSELKKMLSPKFQDRYARAVAKGMMKYISKQKKITPSLL